jgi:plasmid stabilization system protein ParE
MKYTVTWLPSAEDQLADIWNNALDQQAVADASNRIDQILRHNPETKGCPIDDMRFLNASPLTVLFKVSPDDRVVSVVEVHRKN